jgi:tetratricopeptide (TPR) repeat protein
MRRRAWALSVTLLAAVASVAPRVHAEGGGDAADADAEQPEAPKKTKKQLEAEAHYKRAKELYQLGRYREAIAQLEAALVLDPKGAELLYNLGLVHEKLGDADEAIDAYHRYLAVLGNDVDPEEKKKIESVIKRLEGAKAELKAREAKRTEHRFTPLSTSLAVGAGVSLVATVIFGAMALSHDKSARDFTVGSSGTIEDRNALIDRSKREAVLADVFGVVGLAAGGAALALYFTSEFPRGDNPSDAKPPPPVTARVSMRPLPMGGATMQWELVF